MGYGSDALQPQSAPGTSLGCVCHSAALLWTLTHSYSTENTHVDKKYWSWKVLLSSHLAVHSNTDLFPLIWGVWTLVSLCDISGSGVMVNRTPSPCWSINALSIPLMDYCAWCCGGSEGRLTAGQCSWLLGTFSSHPHPLLPLLLSACLTSFT